MYPKKSWLLAHDEETTTVDRVIAGETLICFDVVRHSMICTNQDAIAKDKDETGYSLGSNQDISG